MGSPKLHITDIRMLLLMDYCVGNKIKGVTTQNDWCKAVGAAASNLSNIRKGLQNFTKMHIYTACKYFNVSADYIYGFTDKMSFNPTKTTPIQRIEQALIELKAKNK